MSIKNYTQKLVLITGLAIVIVSTGAEAQRGRGRSYRHYGHGYYHGSRSYSFYRPYLSIGFGGINYRYHSGYFYRPYPGYFRAVYPPFGIRIAMLPPGFHRIYVGSYPYYYYNGTYYSRSERNGYTVVTPPLGARVPDLPRDAQAVVIDGQKYYVLDGTYYKEEVTAGNELWYTVVGINGQLDPEAGQPDNNQEDYRVGDRVDILPADCKPVVISGKKYYEAPSGLYYEEIISPNKVYYEIVGRTDQ